MRKLAAFGFLLGRWWPWSRRGPGILYLGAPHVSTVTERYDAGSDRYFIDWSAHTTPVAASSTGSPRTAVRGPRRRASRGRPGHSPYGCPAGDLPGSAACAPFAPHLPLSRDESARQPQSRFFTINQAECEGLKRPDSGGRSIPLTSTT